MDDFKTIQTDVLVDMLARYTAEYTRMINEGGIDDEFNDCQTKIILLQSEITSRDNFKTTSRYKNSFSAS